jgi:hypothetical protein
MKIDKDGWYAIPHNPMYETGPGWEWMPRRDWCNNTFVETEWYMREVEYKNQPDLTIIEPLTWMFRNEKDAVMFTLKWL